MSATSDPTTITIPAYGIGETITLQAPSAWHQRIQRIADTGVTSYGPSYSRTVVEHLRALSDNVRTGYTTVAYDRLLWAEQAAGVKASAEHFHAGSNDPGYLPDNPAECFTTLADAIAYLASELQHDAETAATWCDGDDADDFHVDNCPTCAGVSALESTALWLEDVDADELAGGWSEVVAGRAYWMTPVEPGDCDDDDEGPEVERLRSYAERTAELYRTDPELVERIAETIDPPRRGSGPGAMLATKRTWNGSRRSLEDVTPEELARYRDGQRVAHNTYVEHDADGSVGVRFHATRIITFHGDGSFTLNTGGYRTTTTKQRLNALLPAGYRVYQVSYVWRIATPEGDFEFYDGDTWKA